MTSPAPAAETPSSSGSGYLPLLLLLFAGSGCSALIYEVVWYQALQLAIGSTSVSLGVLLATFMGGLCIGSTVFPRLNLTKNHPLRVYAFIELTIAVLAILVQFAMPSISQVYWAGAASGLPGMLLRGIVAAVCMLPPTILMGASLPAIVRWLEASPRAVAWWGWLYGGNTAGAVVGCLLAGFWLLREYNTTAGTLFAAAINVVVALVSLALASSTPKSVPVSGPAPAAEAPGPVATEAARSGQSRWPVYLTIALSGAVALGAEVVWTRLLGYLLLATVYVFAIILAVFLTGLALGTAGGSWLLRKVNPRTALGWCQILLVLGFAWTAYTIVNTFHLPFWNDDVLTTQDGWHMYWLDLKLVAIAIFPATLFWGASFPLACAAVSKPGDDSGKTAGSIYAWNTLGGIFGALLVSLVLVPGIGTQNSQRVLLLVSACSGLLLLAPKAKQAMGALALAASVGAAVLLAINIQPTPGELIAYGRFMGRNAGQSEILYTKEGRNSSVAISRWNNGAIYVNVNGHVEATTEIFDMKLQRMVGHLAAILHPNPKSVLGIGFGAGVSAGSFTRYPGIEHITVCEIEPVIPPASTIYFAPQNYAVKNNPKTRIVYDDARHYLMTTNDKYDIIASDPLDVFVKGTAALYSVEYYESVKRHLNPGGIFTLYVPLYETDEATFKSELATFFKAFPNGSVWSNTRDGLGYDMVFMGQLGPLHIDLDKAQEKYDRDEHATVRQSLHEIGIENITDLFSTFTGTAADLQPWIADSPLNTDANLRLSYLAGWGINSDLADYLYRQMLRYRHPPAIFSGSPDRISAVVNHLTM
ncbi:MAG TPA: fused MFS/spermidine synthase [Bryobacteraceae bacterium]|nr:fused MFS/spermidine synthase [Bryobacteraceae bacterium]